MIQIAIADDHAILRKGVAELLSKCSNMRVVIEAATGRELIDKMQAAKIFPDLCIIDINMPGMNGYDTAAVIKKSWPDVKILALSMYDTELNIIKMLRAGAQGYVLKDSDPEELYAAINTVYNSGYFHSGLLTGRKVNVLRDNEDRLEAELSGRETTFLELCCTELTYKEIAEKMFVSPRTIDGYREALFKKFDTTSRTGLVMFAIKTGVVLV